ncbi:peptidoglycan-binding protein [Streptomyces noboritoensis]|uniref:Peptidoglycan-binding protein n=1 Tax=Streptomyces noboritoensis TaxID=67337 RepID=A0ABV6TRZ4_9ACTN
MTGHVCPECGTEREPTGRPACTCALRADRSAEVAASEDFDPLRIRPYVTLEDVGSRESAEGGDPAMTMPLRPVPPHAGQGLGSPMRPGPGTTGLPADELGATAAFRATPQGARGTARPATHDPQPTDRRRRRPLLLAALALAATATIVAFAGGSLFGGDSDTDATGPATTVSTAPDPATTSSSPSPTTPEPRTTPHTSPSPRKSSPSPSRTPKASTSPSRRPATPTPTPSQVTGTVDTTTAPAAPPATAPVLRKGDDGPEVTELQDRLAQLTIYNGRIDGHFGSKTENAVRTYQSYMGLESDPPGVYGPETRSALEAQTS